MSGRVVVITGGSAGIGAELARQLGARGDSLVLGARRESALQSVAREAGNGALAIVADVTRRGDVERLRDAAIAGFGRVDVWINNAGRGIGVKVLDLTEEQFDEIIAVNVKSALYGMQAIVPHFIERRRGHVINMSSFLARVPIATFRSAYNAAKAALNALTANLRMDLRREYPDIHVSTVMPGVVTTDFPRNVIGETPPPVNAGAPGQPRLMPQSPEEVAAQIIELIDHPRAELYTNPGQPALMMRYLEDVEGFERGLG